MEFLEILAGQNNKFDGGYVIGAKELKAMRDAIIDLHTRVKEFELGVSEEKPKKKKNA